ncbi:hypothetical protein AR457_41240 [Streptomyces agglomeratus]|uniref:Uncharacterized protein n=1 Tax=Streptomyces agglomeratus TaxID=285458 RepID=A0A1E5NY21_9ACTN|nr:hypothetical protein [Streptomyces agglomeratus]OEJ21140.1 hypothetical protein AR457_41240 [Streptomyces agglomeratus]OEJ21194.1 hypothetical protein AS594_36715 [Streptomyces agglomeratus]OEJ36580.1 hypothetical protein BGK72_35895 [Streptomyces agglomeratus]OEJ56298.1 hypothetical protein BGM19_36770 [Streptomyces agglomeratus]
MAKRASRPTYWSRRALIRSVKQAAAAIEPGTPAQPFIDVLTELVQEQAGTNVDQGFVEVVRCGVWTDVWSCGSGSFSAM